MGARPIKRITVMIAAAALAVAWVGWAFIAHRRLQAAIAGIYARHEPVYLSDCNFSPLPDNCNAAYYYRSAAAAMSSTVWPPSESTLVYNNYPPFPPAWHQMIDQAMAADAAVFPLVRKARQLNAADWGYRSDPPSQTWTNPAWNNWLNHLSDSRGLAGLLGDAILYAHVRGDDSEAVQYALDLLHLANSISQNDTVIDRLTALGIEALAVVHIEVIAPDLQIQGISASPHAAGRAAVSELIGQLLDERWATLRRRGTMIGKRLEEFNDALSIRDKATILRPMLNLELVRILEMDQPLEEAMSQPDFHAAMASYPMVLATPASNSVHLARIVSQMVVWRPRLMIELEFRDVSERRLAAVSLATRLYLEDHGRWPASLSALVGPYLPYVPEGPFYSGHHPIGYVSSIVSSGRFRPMIYIDSIHGSFSASPPTSPCFGWDNQHSRQWRDLSDWWLAPTTTKP